MIKAFILMIKKYLRFLRNRHILTLGVNHMEQTKTEREKILDILADHNVIFMGKDGNVDFKKVDYGSVTFHYKGGKIEYIETRTTEM